jgi:hypothetical protein
MLHNFLGFLKILHCTVRPRYQAIPISANFVSKLFSIVPKNTHRVLFFGISTH